MLRVDTVFWREHPYIRTIVISRLDFSSYANAAWASRAKWKAARERIEALEHGFDDGARAEDFPEALQRVAASPLPLEPVRGLSGRIVRAAIARKKRLEDAGRGPIADRAPPESRSDGFGRQRPNALA